MRRFLSPVAALLLSHCSSSETRSNATVDGGGASGGRHGDSGAGSSANGGASGGNPTGSGGKLLASGGRSPGSGGTSPASGGAHGNPDRVDASGSTDSSTPPPKLGQPGCGFATAAFCDTFDGPSARRGRAGELDAMYWSAGRMDDALSTTRAMGIGMAVIPHCRPGTPTNVWPDGDTLVCDPTPDIASNHLLIGTAAQYYGQNGYRIRQPFDFANRTGKIVFDSTVNLLSPLHGWVSLAVTEDPISMPGYSIQSNDEGNIIPKNAIEVHFANFGDDTKIFARGVHVFKNYVDTVYGPPQISDAPSFKPGKLNHFEFQVSEHGIEVTITPYSDDGKTFVAPTFDYKVNAELPFSRGYVHVSVHNHATLKYTQPDSHMPAIVDAAVAQIDNVGFDGPVLDGWREYEVPDALVKFSEPGFQPLPDPYNPDSTGYDLGYVLNDVAAGPKQVLHFKGVDASNVTSARLAFSGWADFLTRGGSPEKYTFSARLNGKAWHDRQLSAEEAAFFTTGPTTVDPNGAPLGKPGTQGRLGLILDMPKEDLVDGDNTVEFVSANILRTYPPLVCNVDLVLSTQ